MPMQSPRPAPRVARRPGLLPITLIAGGAAAAAASLGGCGGSGQPPGVYLEFRVDQERYRPEAIRFTWMRAGAELITSRLPETGVFSGNDPLLGTIFIQTGGPLAEPRLVAVQGLRGDSPTLPGNLVSGAAAVVPPSSDPVQRWSVMLAAPLPDANGDGKPDIVQQDCLRGGPAACNPFGPPPPDGGPTADGGADAQPADGGTPLDGAGDGGAALAAGLVGHWRLDEGAGTQARDSSGLNNHGALRGFQGPWLAGRHGMALEIPATPGVGVLVPQSSSIDGLRSAFTIAAWTYRTSHQPRWASALSRRYLDSTSEHYILGFQTGVAKAMINTQLSDDGNAATVSGTTPAPLDRWVHLALTYDGATLRLYQDGVAVGVEDYDQPLVGDRTPLCLGCNQNLPGDTAADEPLSGRLDEVLLYGRALSAGDIARLAAGESP
jgi:hypothetical protein